MTSRSRAWCFTWNNPERSDISEILNNEKNKVRYAVWQRERGASGTEHLQGYIQFDSQITLATVKKRISKTAHFEIARGNAADNKRYCTKEDTRIEGPWEIGSAVDKGMRSDIVKAKEILNEGGMSKLADEMPEMIVKYPRGMQMLHGLLQKKSTMRKRLNIDVFVLLGKPGTGKTRYVYDTEGFENTYSLTVGDRLWFDGYEGQKVLLIDEFYGGIKYSMMLQLLDIYPLRLDIKGGSVWANWEKVYITSNSPVREWYKGVPDTGALERRIKNVFDF